MDKKKLHLNEAEGIKYPEPDVPVEDAWNNMKQLLQHSPAAPAQTRFPAGKGKFFMAAAGTGIVAIVALLIYVVAGEKEKRVPTPVTFSSDATPKAGTLYDGTIVYLDNQSSIAATNEDEKDKQLILTRGGCYFKQINNGATASWQLQLGSVGVQPHKANIYCSFDPATSMAEIQLQNGHATIQMGNQKLELAAGESIHFNTKENSMPVRQKTDPNLYSYANKVFEFSNTPFKEAAGYIEKAYGMKFIIKNNKLNHCTITTRFDNKSLEEILDILGYTLTFEYSIDKNKNQVIISGDGCN